VPWRSAPVAESCRFGKKKKKKYDGVGVVGSRRLDNVARNVIVVGVAEAVVDPATAVAAAVTVA
jgi:hypothetical protein